MLTEEIPNENHHLDIPQKTLDNEITTLIADIENKPDFNKDKRFDPEKHIIFSDDAFEKTKKYSLCELVINRTHCQPLLHLAGTNPFPLFSEETIDMMKWEIFNNPDFVKEFGRVTSYGKGAGGGCDIQVSEFIHKTKFTLTELTHPRTKQIFSKVARMKVRMPHVFSMGSVNASFAPVIDGKVQKESASELKELKKEARRNGK